MCWRGVVKPSGFSPISAAPVSIARIEKCVAPSAFHASAAARQRSGAFAVVDDRLDAEAGPRAAGGVERLVQRLAEGLHRARRRAEQEAVADARGAPDRGRREAAEPDRDAAPAARGRMPARSTRWYFPRSRAARRARAGAAARPARPCACRASRTIRSSASYSTQFQPVPTPSRSRPPESSATSAACFATSAVWRCGRMITPVASSSRVVTRGEEAVQHERLVEADRARCRAR